MNARTLENGMAEADWFALVRSMPYLEQEQLLRDRKNDLLARVARKDDNSHAAGLAVGAINDELHRLCQQMNRASWGKAVHDVFGQEGWEKVRVRMAQLEEWDK